MEGAGVGTPRRAWVEQAMGLPFSIHVRGASARTTGVERAVEEAFTELRRLDDLFSPFSAGSEISRLDRGELTLRGCSPLVVELLELAELARARTGGAFDVRLPGPDGRRRLDTNGLVKAWAAERAAAIVTRAIGDDDLLLNAGGDVVVTCGSDRWPPWCIGIEDPDDPSLLLATIERRDGAVATSGSAHRGGHILDPRTGEACLAVRSATVVGPSLLWADVYATAAVVRGRGAHRFLADLDGYDGIVVEPGAAVG